MINTGSTKKDTRHSQRSKFRPGDKQGVGVGEFGGKFGGEKPKLVKPMSFNEATEGSTTRGKAGWGRMTSSERSDWRVNHGVAPTAADPSALGKATRATAKAARARGELSEQDQRDQKIIKVREIDEAKYDASLKANKILDAGKNKSNKFNKRTFGVGTFSGKGKKRTLPSVNRPRPVPSATTAIKQKSLRQTPGILNTNSSTYGSLT